MFRRDAFALVAVALIGIVFTFFIAIGSTPFFPKSLETRDSECPANEYFPAQRGPVLDEFSASWFSNELLSLGEQPLFHESERNQRIVRFTLLRSFHAPLTVRTVESPDGQVRLIAKWSAGYDGCDPATAVCSIDRLLTQEEHGRLVVAQDPVLRKESYGCPSSVDGAMWIFESIGYGDYRFWNEWSPTTGDLRALALVLIELTGWRLKELY